MKRIKLENTAVYKDNEKVFEKMHELLISLGFQREDNVNEVLYKTNNETIIILYSKVIINIAYIFGLTINNKTYTNKNTYYITTPNITQLYDFINRVKSNNKKELRKHKVGKLLDIQ